MVERSAVQEIPRQTKAERQQAGVQGSLRAIAWIQPAARLVHQPRQEGSGRMGEGVRAKDLEIPSNPNYSTILNGADVVMILSQYWEKIGGKIAFVKSIHLWISNLFLKARPLHISSLLFPNNDSIIGIPLTPFSLSPLLHVL